MKSSRKLQTLFALVAGYLAFAGTSTATPPVPDARQVGPHAIGHVSLVFADPSRPTDLGDRPIPVEVFYPVDQATIDVDSPEGIFPLDPIRGWMPVTTSSLWEDLGHDPVYEGVAPSLEGPFPLVVFSPGWTVGIWADKRLAGRLASHGIVVAVMYHYGDGAWQYEPFDHLATACLNRPLDSSFVLTELLALNAAPDGLLTNVLNPDQVVAAGWSLGGYGAMVLAGGDDNVGEFADSIFGGAPPDTFVPNEPDPRFKAVISFDGSVQILQDHELERIHVPVLSMGRSWTPEYDSLMRLHAAAQGHPNYRVDVLGSTHQALSNWVDWFRIMYIWGWITEEDLAGICASFCGVLSDEEQHDLMGMYGVAFIKTVLARESGYQHILTPGYARVHEPAIEFFVTEPNGR